MTSIAIIQDTEPSYEPTEDGYRKMLKDLGWSTQKVTAAITQLRKGKAERVEDFEGFKAHYAPKPEVTEGVAFGMEDHLAARHIADTFGITPRIARRAVDRGMDRDEYIGKGYRVVVTDAPNDRYNIVVFPHSKLH